jgi:hypothetical protein
LEDQKPSMLLGCRESCSATWQAEDRRLESVWGGDHVTAAREAITM